MQMRSLLVPLLAVLPCACASHKYHEPPAELTPPTAEGVDASGMQDETAAAEKPKPA